MGLTCACGRTGLDSGPKGGGSAPQDVTTATGQGATGQGAAGQGAAGQGAAGHGAAGQGPDLATPGVGAGGELGGLGPVGRADGGRAESAGRSSTQGNDAQTAEAAGPDAGRIAWDCDAILPIGQHVAVAVRTPRQLLFGDALPIVVATSRDGDLLSIDPRTGVHTLLGQKGRELAWFDENAGEILAIGTDGTLSVVSLAGAPSRSLATEACGYLPTPDRQRIYVVRACSNDTGTLERIDSRTGSSTPVAAGARKGGMVVSSDGRTIAFEGSANGGSMEIVAAYEPRAQVRALHGNPTLGDFGFLANDVLVYEMGDGSQSTVHAYAPAQDQDENLGSGLTLGYGGPFASLRTGVLLAAQSPAVTFQAPISLFSLALGERRSVEIATDLMPYYLYQMPLTNRAFALTATGEYAVYVSESCPALGVDGGCTTQYAKGMRSVPAHGGTSIQLSAVSDLRFQLSPTSDDVALVETKWLADSSREEVLRVVSAATGATLLSYSATGSLGAPSWVSDGRGILFKQTTTSNTEESRLFHVPLREVGEPIEIGRWGNKDLDYAIDPHGCLVAHPSPDDQSTVFSRIP